MRGARKRDAAISTAQGNASRANVPDRNCGLCTVDCFCHCEERGSATRQSLQNTKRAF
ncbi:MAG: hypothetical protein LBL66_01110 [Clostridiales bacterium]|nr:hypothetical protein [Clostridiales bacterium]